MGDVVWDVINLTVWASSCLSYPRQNEELLDSIGCCVINPSRPAMAVHGSQRQR